MNLFGLTLGVTDESVAPLVDGFLARSPRPSPADVAAFLRLLTGDEKPIAARQLIARGVDPRIVDEALRGAPSDLARYWRYATIASAAASAFHGYRRNQSIFWGLTWFVMGMLLPVITPTIALAQGFGQRRKD